MSRASKVEVTETPEFGTVLKCHDIELADEFEDFLTEDCFVLFKTKLDPDEVTFLFGQASSVDTVQLLYDRFERERLQR